MKFVQKVQNFRLEKTDFKMASVKYWKSTLQMRLLLVQLSITSQYRPALKLIDRYCAESLFEKL